MVRTCRVSFIKIHTEIPHMQNSHMRNSRMQIIIPVRTNFVQFRLVGGMVYLLHLQMLQVHQCQQVIRTKGLPPHLHVVGRESSMFFLINPPSPRGGWKRGPSFISPDRTARWGCPGFGGAGSPARADQNIEIFSHFLVFRLF